MLLAEWQPIRLLTEACEVHRWPGCSCVTLSPLKLTCDTLYFKLSACPLLEPTWFWPVNAMHAYASFVIQWLQTQLWWISSAGCCKWRGQDPGKMCKCATLKDTQVGYTSNRKKVWAHTLFHICTLVPYTLEQVVARTNPALVAGCFLVTIVWQTDYSWKKFQIFEKKNKTKSNLFLPHHSDQMSQRSQVSSAHFFTSLFIPKDSFRGARIHKSGWIFGILGP